MKKHIFDEEGEESQEPAAKRRQARSFQYQWKGQFAWLEYIQPPETQSMFCNECVEHNNNNNKILSAQVKDVRTLELTIIGNMKSLVNIRLLWRAQW